MAKKIKTEVLPLKGLPVLQFGDTVDQIEFLMGPPEETETLDPGEEGEFPMLVYYYWDDCITFFFNASAEKPYLIMMETDDLDAMLFDKKIFKLKPQEVVSLLAGNKSFEYEKETEAWGQTRYSWDDLNMDFYFEGNKLETLTWGAQLDEDLRVIIPELRPGT